MFGFEKLEVWKLAVELADAIYQPTAVFPPDERFGLTNQMRRSAVSVAANIAEGSGRGTNRDFRRFLEIAYGSLMETVSHLEIARKRSYVSADTHASSTGALSESHECSAVSVRVSAMTILLTLNHKP